MGGLGLLLLLRLLSLLKHEIRFIIRLGVSFLEPDQEGCNRLERDSFTTALPSRSEGSSLVTHDSKPSAEIKIP